MSRYIDADKIIYSWQIDPDGQEHDGVTLQSIINKMPSIDAVLVVRCKDCIHSTSQVSDDEDNYYCNAMMRCMHSLEYCSHGERKES